jgi:type I restriction enzyme R subunit
MAAVSGPEYTHVEAPFVDQLVSMGWKHTTGSLDHPSATGRESFREVILEADMRRMLRRINLDAAGQPWLDDGRIGQAVSAITRIQGASLIEANQAATRLLHWGIVVEGLPGWDGGRARSVRFIDWDHPENNEFRVGTSSASTSPAARRRPSSPPTSSSS